MSQLKDIHHIILAQRPTGGSAILNLEVATIDNVLVKSKNSLCGDPAVFYSSKDTFPFYIQTRT